MKALILREAGKIELAEISKPVAAAGKALVKIKAASLNRRDDWIREGKYPNIKFGVTMGSDGAGIVEAVGDEKDQPWVGQEVVINPNIDWGADPEVQSGKYTILGMPVDGTFCRICISTCRSTASQPFHLDFLQASTLPLGGLTAFRALFRRGELRAGAKRVNLWLWWWSGAVCISVCTGCWSQRICFFG
jgi:zinc-binding alcohol dehydrogenase/oxidoreductase